MEVFALAVDKFKDFGKSTQDFVLSILHWQQNANRRNPIEILKRLQREAFSDIMKLRDRQEKVERVLSFYKSSKGSPFEESATHVRGDIDLAGVVFMTGIASDQQYKAIRNSGIRTGLDLRLVFETTVRQKDSLVAVFDADEQDKYNIPERPLSLAKVLYAANISDWFSAVAIPLGAQCRDVGVAMNSCCEEKGFSEYSALGPPLLNQKNGSALGIMVKRSNIVASLGQFVSGLGSQGSEGIKHCFSTFGQIVYQLSQGTKLSLLGVHKVTRLSSERVSPGAMAFSFDILNRRKYSETFVEVDRDVETDKKVDLLDGSLALMFGSELDESTQIRGWIEMKHANSPYFQWAVTLSDTPEDDVGWGVSMGGLAQGPRSWDHFQVEAFLNFSFGKRFTLRPAVVYSTNGELRCPALALRSSWSL